MVGGYTEDTKNHNTVKIFRWVLAWDNTVYEKRCCIRDILRDTKISYCLRTDNESVKVYNQSVHC